MSSALNRPWLIAGRSGNRLLYGDLIGELREPRLKVAVIAQPKRTEDCLRLLSRALLGESELTLVDPQYRAQELGVLGINSYAFAETVDIVGRPELTLYELMDLAGGSSRMRLGLFTSGSTDIPKKIIHGLGSLARSVRRGAHHTDDVWALTYRPTHIAGVQVWLQALANGNTLVDITEMTPAEAVEAIITYDVTHISATPTYYRTLIGVGRSLPGVRSVTLGGELAVGRLFGQMHRFFPNARFRNIYASTETGPLLESSGEFFKIPEDKLRQIKIEDQSLHVHRSLLPRPIQSIESPSEDWYNTGDVVEMSSDASGLFRFVGRDREWANIGGFKVNPREVEDAIRELRAIEDARVIVLRNSVTGEVLSAEVICRAKGLTEADVRESLCGRLHPSKIPRIIRFVSQLPKTKSGKILRR